MNLTFTRHIRNTDSGDVVIYECKEHPEYTIWTRRMGIRVYMVRKNNSDLLTQFTLEAAKRFVDYMLQPEEN